MLLMVKEMRDEIMRVYAQQLSSSEKCASCDILMPATKIRMEKSWLIAIHCGKKNVQFRNPEEASHLRALTKENLIR